MARNPQERDFRWGTVWESRRVCWMAGLIEWAFCTARTNERKSDSRGCLGWGVGRIRWKRQAEMATSMAVDMRTEFLKKQSTLDPNLYLRKKGEKVRRNNIVDESFVGEQTCCVNFFFISLQVIRPRPSSYNHPTFMKLWDSLKESFNEVPAWAWACGLRFSD